MAEAEMNAGAKRNVPVRLAIEIELFGMRIGGRIHIGSREHGHDPLTLLDCDAAQIDVPAYVARLGELDRGEEAQKLLHRKISAAPVFLEPVAQISVFQELMHGATDEMCRRLVAG